MKKLELEVFLQSHKIIVLISSIGIVFVCLFFAIKGLIIISPYTTDIIENPVIFGGLATLLGAIIGGAFTLLGSIWVNSKQGQAKENIRRRNIIYFPLYDELIENQNIVADSNPYPNIVEFKKGPRMMVPRPQFTAWTRIKADNRYLEVPDILKEQMQKLEAAIVEYLKVRSEKVPNEIKAAVDKVLVENGYESCRISNIGDVLSRVILRGEKDSKFKEEMREIFTNHSIIEDDCKQRIINSVYEECNKNETIIDARRKYIEWQDVQGESIKMLELLILHVNLKYEG